MSRRLLATTFAVLLLGSSAGAHAQAAKNELTGRLWYSLGHTVWSHDASTLDPNFGNPTSELSYEDINAPVLELEYRRDFGNRLSLRSTLGLGTISDGTLIDDDYLSEDGADNLGAMQDGAHRFSRTESDISGDNLFYLSVEMGYGLLKPDASHNLDFVLGYQYWREKYEAKGVRSLECTLPGTGCLPAGTEAFQDTTVISNTVTWQSAYLGVDGSYIFNRRWSLAGRGLLVPFAGLENEDVHHLRQDLSQDPSFLMKGVGYGFDLELEGAYRLTSMMTLRFGYRYWLRSVENETWRVYDADGNTARANLNQFETTRHGPHVGLQFLF